LIFIFIFLNANEKMSAWPWHEFQLIGAASIAWLPEATATSDAQSLKWLDATSARRKKMVDVLADAVGAQADDGTLADDAQLGEATKAIEAYLPFARGLLIAVGKDKESSFFHETVVFRWQPSSLSGADCIVRSLAVRIDLHMAIVSLGIILLNRARLAVRASSSSSSSSSGGGGETGYRTASQLFRRAGAIFATVSQSRLVLDGPSASVPAECTVAGLEAMRDYAWAFAQLLVVHANIMTASTAAPVKHRLFAALCHDSWSRVRGKTLDRMTPAVREAFRDLEALAQMAAHRLAAEAARADGQHGHAVALAATALECNARLSTQYKLALNEGAVGGNGQGMLTMLRLAALQEFEASVRRDNNQVYFMPLAGAALPEPRQLVGRLLPPPSAEAETATEERMACPDDAWEMPPAAFKTLKVGKS
jgi:hypothetical protein